MTEMSKPPFRVLTMSCTGADLIDAQKIDAFFSNEALLKLTRDKAIKYLLAARKRAHVYRKTVKERTLLERDEALRKLKSEASDAALKWLIDEQLWSRKVSDEIEKKMYQSLHSQLSTLFNTLPWDSLLLASLRNTVRDVSDGSSVDIYISSDSYALLSTQLTGEHVRIHQDENLRNGMAVVENSIVRVEVDLRTQLDNLLHQIGRLGREPQ